MVRCGGVSAQDEAFKLVRCDVYVHGVVCVSVVWAWAWESGGCGKGKRVLRQNQQHLLHETCSC